MEIHFLIHLIIFLVRIGILLFFLVHMVQLVDIVH